MGTLTQEVLCHFCRKKNFNLKKSEQNTEKGKLFQFVLLMYKARAQVKAQFVWASVQYSLLPSNTTAKKNGVRKSKV